MLPSVMQIGRPSTATRYQGTVLRSIVVASAICLALLLLVSRAHAAYQQLPLPDGVFAGSPTALKTDEEFSEEVQLGGVGAMAVNRSGAGGVPAGTLYAVTDEQFSGARVAMYQPDPVTGKLEFTEGWQVASSDSYERCGPALGVDLQGKAENPCAPRPRGSGEASAGLDVDQATGDVYVYSDKLALGGPGSKVIVVYKADGSEVLTRFAELAPDGGTAASSTDKVHNSSGADTLAVNEAGEVFLYDKVLFGENYRRLMVFQPHAGNLDEYEYVGEIAGGPVDQHVPSAPNLDDAGNLYVAGMNNQFQASGNIEALAPETPGPYPRLAKPPRCSSKVKGSGLYAMTVDPVTGEPFYFTEKRPSRIGRFGPCDESTHQFAESATPEEIPIEPAAEYIVGLAVNPDADTGNSRPPGAIYAGRPNPDGQVGQSALGYVLGHPQVLGPEVLSESLSHVTASGAVASATIDPNGFGTSYVFQYLSDPEYSARKAQAEGEGKSGEEAEDIAFEGAPEAPLGGASIDGTGGVQNVSVALAPLLPGTTYYFRVVTESSCSGEAEPPCEAKGEAFGFRTFPLDTPTLPDGRAWELVSPPQKHGGQVIPADPREDSAQPGQTYDHFAMLSADDGNTIAYEGTPFGTSGALIENEYVARRDPVTGWQTTGLSPALYSRGAAGYQALSRSLDVAVFQQGSESSIVAGGSAGYANLYSQSTSNPLPLTPLLSSGTEFNRSGDEFAITFAATSADGSRVFFAANDALTPEAEDGGAAKNNLYEWHAGELALVNVLPGGDTEAGATFGTASANPVSEDGLRAFFSDSAGQVYMREGGVTTQIPDGGKFLAAAKDGSRVLLADGFLYDLETASGTDLTEGVGGFKGELGQSDDLSHVYFVADQVLPAAEPVCREGTFAEVCEEAAPGVNNLYAWEEDGQARFVAQLAANDNEAEDANFPGQSDWSRIPANRTAESSPNGRYLAFMSGRQLTGYGNTGPCESDNAGGFVPHPCPEAFVYDAAIDRLVCASCNPTGARPLGWAVLMRIKNGSELLQPRYLTDSGRLLFTSKDSLSPRDTNEGFEDVYQWEPKGIGDCDTEFAEGGCVSLISAGNERTNTRLLGVDETGRNVFFTTRDRLVQADKDEVIDLYDAREGGGFAAETETQQSECQGESCQPPVVVPNDPTPGSSSFVGPGNVKEPAKKKPHKKKHHKKKHQKKAKHGKKQRRSNHDRRAH